MKPSFILFCFILFCLTACSEKSATAVHYNNRYSSPAIGGTSYSKNSNPTISGYDCVEDCSGHEAGKEWAEENDVTDPDDCGGKSESFIEGCRSYGEELNEEAAQEVADEEAERDAILESNNDSGDEYR